MLLFVAFLADDIGREFEKASGPNIRRRKLALLGEYYGWDDMYRRCSGVGEWVVIGGSTIENLSGDAGHFRALEHIFGGSEMTDSHIYNSTLSGFRHITARHPHGADMIDIFPRDQRPS